MSKSCPLCLRSKKKEEVLYSELLNLPGNCESRVVFCESCGLYYLWPYVPKEKISELYGKSYFTGVVDANASQLAPSTNSDYELEFASARMSKFKETVEMLLKSQPDAVNILDVGAATGDFLAIAKNAGLEVSGIELSAYAASKAKEKYGFVFHELDLDDYQGKEQYDFIHMNHVFEHLDDPHRSLEKMHDLLKSDGLVYIEVPFQFNWFEVIKYKIRGVRKVFDVFSIHHPVFYRPETLKKIFNQHGFHCKQLNVFSWSRYPACSLLGQLKRLMWLCASWFGQGIMIEAVFEKKTHK